MRLWLIKYLSLVYPETVSPIKQNLMKMGSQPGVFQVVKENYGRYIKYGLKIKMIICL